jgi:hypothetical protein
MFKALFNYFPVIPALVGLLVFCLIPFEEPNMAASGPESTICPERRNFPVQEPKRDAASSIRVSIAE